MFNIIIYILVGILLVSVLGLLIFEIIKLNTKLIRVGEYDQKLQVEIPKLRDKKRKKVKIAKTVVSIATLAIMLILLVFSIVVRVQDNNEIVGRETIKVVYSDSMSYKHQNNVYLKNNKLNNQFKKFDLIIVQKLPQEQDLNLYDIVVYEKNGILIIHRIVSIQTREIDGLMRTIYILKGDANKEADSQVVTYDQMRGLYTGKRIPVVGVLVVFMQSPAGWISFVIIGLYMLADEIMHKKLLKVSLERYKEVYGEIVLEEPEVKDTKNNSVQNIETSVVPIDNIVSNENVEILNNQQNQTQIANNIKTEINDEKNKT